LQKIKNRGEAPAMRLSAHPERASPRMKVGKYHETYFI
jgi:hypothetical protein